METKVMQAAHKPSLVVEWKDSEDTGAVGWIVIDRLVNGVSGGGLFMHPAATLHEVEDLARTMSFKNGLQNPVFGGGKGGIRFNHEDPRAEGVLKRFLLANKEVLRTKWCTGADLNTSNEVIHRIIRENLGLESGFACLGNMLYSEYGIESQAAAMLGRIAAPANEYFRLAESATGFGAAHCLKLLGERNSRILIQGFGAVGKSLAYYITEHELGTVVGISDSDGFIYNEDGIDVIALLEKSKTLAAAGRAHVPFHALVEGLTGRACNWTPKTEAEHPEAFLRRFLSVIKADVFCPCATRYGITDLVLHTLENFTFSETLHQRPLIVCGANNVFATKAILRKAKQSPITFVPEWLSNCGNALLFMEAMKTQDDGAGWVRGLLDTIAERIDEVLYEAKGQQEIEHLPLYDQCISVVTQRMHAVIS